MLSGRKIGIVGCGNIGEALLRGLLASGAVGRDRVRVSVGTETRRAALGAAHGVVATVDNRAVASFADLLVLAVKPQILGRVLGEIAPAVQDGTVVVSVAAGVSTAAIEARVGGARVVRTMPNTPVLVRAGATAVAAGSRATAADVALAQALFDSVGITEVLDESQMDAVTGLSGSGPAYLFLILDALCDAGVKVGIRRTVAQRLAAQTILGATRLLLESGAHPGLLKDMVTSPGGTAIAGIHTLEAGGLRTTLMNAVEAATRRSAELGAQVDAAI
jgi:pyrroline-5-carboxylate reductase